MDDTDSPLVEEEIGNTARSRFQEHLGEQGTSREETLASTGTTQDRIINSYQDDAREREEELIKPDVSHIVPPKYEDVRMRKGGGPCRKSRRERVLRKKVECGDREVVR